LAIRSSADPLEGDTCTSVLSQQFNYFQGNV